VNHEPFDNGIPDASLALSTRRKFVTTIPRRWVGAGGANWACHYPSLLGELRQRLRDLELNLSFAGIEDAAEADLSRYGFICTPLTRVNTQYCTKLIRPTLRQMLRVKKINLFTSS
jgi:hypothetical protein